MVVNVYVEGGIINGNVDATTSNNSEALREELNRFMQHLLVGLPTNQTPMFR